MVFMSTAVPLLLVLAQTDRGSAEACFAPPPCTCDTSSVLCDYRNLTAVPKFTVSSVNYSTLYIDLTGNKITTVPDSAFLNVSTTHASNIRISLASNLIAKMGNDAFRGIEGNLTSIDLHGNMLPELPLAFRNLTAVNIYNNKIHEFSPTTMQILGLRLKRFTVGADTQFLWPPEFRYLINLEYLTLYHFAIKYLPNDAFSGFEKTLKQLQVEFSQLPSIPPALCTLTNLQSFSFNFNTDLASQSRIFSPCFPILSSVRTIILVGNKLKEFPAVIPAFPALSTLQVVGNPFLTYIDSTDMPANTHLTTLELSNNGFQQIPEAIHNVTSLLNLDISNNHIETIEEFNLMNMTQLKHLTLSYNPILYIAEHAFQGLTAMETLDMRNTKLGDFPKALRHVPSLKVLALDNNEIFCSCAMSWMRDWKTLDKLQISGNCGSSSLTLTDYIVNYLPKCP